MESFILFYEKCRLCLEEPGVCNMFEREELPEDIYLCTGVKVHPTDNLPQKICSKCSKVIASAKELRTIAIKNNTHLRSLFDGEDDSEPRLQIDEGDISSSGLTKDNISSPSKKIGESPKKSSGSPNKKKITVRKDLFDTSATVTSSTKNNAEVIESKSKKIKLEDQSIIHECSTCKKVFDTAKKLYLHQRMHNKSVVCPLDACSKRFATKGDLEKHFRTHTGEKPFVCNVCRKSFAQRGTLKAHRESVHPPRNPRTRDRSSVEPEASGP